MVRIAITGASGLVGRRLAAFLSSQGHEILRLSRQAGQPGVALFRPDTGTIDAKALAGCEAVIHLAGENIAARRWNAAQKERIRTSRVAGTTLLSETLANLPQRPRVLISASAIGFYGDRGDYECDENASSGTGFLPDVCVAWERATEPAVAAGIRVVSARIGLVLSREGGALAPMLLPFRLGLGGIVGPGTQYWSWIALADLVRAIDFCVRTESIRGPVNAVAPQPVTNAEFTKTLGRVLHRPTIFPMPAFALRLMLGEMADTLVLASTKVVPKRLLAAGFQFEAPDLETGLRKSLE